MLTAEEALDRLKKGNERFVNGQTQHLKLLTHQQRAEMAESQEPFAIVLGWVQIRQNWQGLLFRHCSASLE